LSVILVFFFLQPKLEQSQRCLEADRPGQKTGAEKCGIVRNVPRSGKFAKGKANHQRQANF
jgi:hypothetical protein